MAAVPFTLESGLSKVSGVLREGPDALIIEYQTKFIGLIRSEIKTIQIPFREIDEAVYSANIFSARLRILFKTLRNIGDFPAPNQGELVLEIARKNREAARRFASSINLSVSKYELLDEDENWEVDL